MSILDKASLIQIPSGYKSTKLYSLRPTNGDGDFTFARSSSATRVNSEGLIEVASVLGSELVLSTLINSSYDTFNEASVSGFHAIYSTSGTQRASTVDEINFVNGKTYQVNIDVSVVNGSAPFFRAREAVATSPTIFSGQLIAGNNLITFTSTNTLTGVLEFSNTTVSEYRVSNVSVKEVITNDVPRLDYSGGASCASLLLEKQSTNLITYSEAFDNAVWNKENVTIIANNTTSPDGTTNSDKISETASNTYHALSDALSISSGNDYTISIFAKADERDFLILRSNFSGSNVNTTFDLNNGLVTYNGHSSASIESFSNGWYRCIVTSNSAVTTVNFAFLPSPINITDNNLPTYLGVIGSGVHIYGAQLEQGSYPTSYIISNSGSQTTRIADECNGAGTSATFNSTEGVLFAEIAALADDLTYRSIGLNSGSATNRLLLTFNNVSNNINFLIQVGGVTQVNINYASAEITSKNKIALKYKANDFALWINGTEVATDTSGSTFSASTLNKLSFDNAAGADAFYGKTKQLMYFDEALSDEELSDLTGQVNLSFNNLATFYNYIIL